MMFRKSFLRLALSAWSAFPANAQECDPTTHSYITLPLSIPLDELQTQLNASVDEVMRGIENDPVPGRLVDDTLGWAARRSDIVLRPSANGGLIAKANIRGNVQLTGGIQIVRGAVGALLNQVAPANIPISQSSKLEARVVGDFRPILREDWSLNPRAVASVQVTQAEAKIAKLGRLSFRKLLQPTVQEKVDKLMAKLNRDLPKDQFLRKEAQDLWDDSHKVIEVRGDVPGWIVTKPVRFEAVQPFVDQQENALRLGLSLCFEATGVLTPNRPDRPRRSDVPPLKFIDKIDTGGIAIRLPVSASWDRLSEIATSEITQTEMKWPQNGRAFNMTLSNATLSGTNDGDMTVKLGLSASKGWLSRVLFGQKFDGDITFTATPQLTDNKLTMVNARITEESDGLLLKSAKWLLKGKLEELVETHVHADLTGVKAETEASTKEALRRLAQDMRYDGFGVSFNDADINLIGFTPSDRGLEFTLSGVTTTQNAQVTFVPQF
ncbi:DUF4403 family protein [Aliiroseovarius sp. F20344]|uniref:DUF4403 family protein n=1 Tax=Aliiroseovarius sp. F20344 TaxID=2926414 RepID=UPI001FF2B5B8|nr:DUF4403 family protein [Aliiroseovarius sp. F20344]MCK0142480.1 DUF4403 family protein [Aliiroseovarius sp. F20344]